MGKNKKVCRYCSKLFLRNEKYSELAWSKAKYCDSKCAGAAKRKYKDKKERFEAYRRSKGMAERGTDAASVNISLGTKAAMQRDEVQAKLRASRQPLSQEHRQSLSDSHQGVIPLNMSSPGSYGHIQRGYFDIGGETMFFRSKWEANYALYLNFLIKHGEIKSWEFEPDTFLFEKIITGTRTYTPDFKVVLNTDRIEYHEVKGYMDPKSKTKLKRMAKYYPEISLILVDKDAYYDIKKKVGKLCGFFD